MCVCVCYLQTICIIDIDSELMSVTRQRKISTYCDKHDILFAMYPKDTHVAGPNLTCLAFYAKNKESQRDAQKFVVGALPVKHIKRA